MFVLDWMTKNVITVKKDDSIENLTNLMNINKINHLPVVSDNKVIGIITRSDVRQAITSLKYNKTKSQVSDFMTRDVITVKKYDTLEDVLLLIYNKKVGALPVIDEDNNLIGIITRHDILRAFIKVTGLDKSGITVILKIEDKPEVLERLIHTLNQTKCKILSFFTLEKDNNYRLISIRFDCINKMYIENILKKEGYKIYKPWE
jgi:acetoin utilization protein AcuB